MADSEDMENSEEEVSADEDHDISYQKWKLLSPEFTSELKSNYLPFCSYFCYDKIKQLICCCFVFEHCWSEIRKMQKRAREDSGKMLSAQQSVTSKLAISNAFKTTWTAFKNSEETRWPILERVTQALSWK